MRRAREPGFTLVEVILAAAVTALIAASATMVLRGITEADRRIERQAQLGAEARAAANAIVEAMRNAHRPTGEDERPALEGIDDVAGLFPRDRIRFLTVDRRPVRPGQPESDVREVEFGILESDDEESPPTLVRRLDPTRNDGEDGGGVLERIAAGVLALNITYHDGVQYRDEWTEDLGWPVAVRVELVVAPVDVAGEPTEVTSQPFVVSRLVALPHGYHVDAAAGEMPDAEQAETGGGQLQQEGGRR